MKSNSDQTYTNCLSEGKGIFQRTPTMLTEELYTVREASALTRLAYWTIWDYLKRGVLMRTKVGGKTMIRRSELEKLIVDVPKPRKVRATEPAL